MKPWDQTFQAWVNDPNQHLIKRFGLNKNSSQDMARLKEFARFDSYLRNNMGRFYDAKASDEEIFKDHKRAKEIEGTIAKQKRADALNNLNKMASRFDAFTGVGNALERDLEALDPRTYKILYQDQSIWRDFVPVRTDIRGPGIVNYRYKMRDFSAKVKESSEAVSDIPMVNANAAWFEQAITKFSAGYQLTDDEIKAFMMLGESPSEADLMALDEAYTRKHYSAVLTGLENGVTGLLNNANFDNAAVATIAGPATTWAAKKALGTQVGLDAIYDDIVEMVVSQRTASQENFWTPMKPGTIKLPIAQYMLIATTPRSLTSASDTTILNYVLQNLPGVASIEPMLDLVGAGTGATDLMLGYVNDPEYMEYIITQERMWLPVQIEGEIWKYGSNEKVAGLVVRNSVQGAYRYGI